jgi:tetratricopeptide (TPR) repeat protein
MTFDNAEDYLIGRGSLLYFARRNEEMKQLMIKAVAMDTAVGWGYDWLGMAYVELKDYDNAIKTYYKAFELSDGTVEVGAGLGHALGLAGKYDIARQMADYYTLAARDHYLPPVQRAFIHIGINEYEKALDLLEQAYSEHSWFLVFIKVEPWYDPIKKDKRFIDIINKMGFPENN